MLQTAVDLGNLSFDDYLARVQGAMRTDTALVKACLARGFKDVAAVALDRIRRMKAEYDAATATE